METNDTKELLEAEENMTATNGGLEDGEVEQGNEESGKEVPSEEVVQEVEETGNEEPGVPETVLGGIDEAVAKLQEELKGAKDKSFAEPVLNHLIERVKESESLAKDILQKHKTWEKCYKYIYDQARKQIKGSSGAVRDDVVYEWAEDYFHLDDKAIEAKKAAEAKKKAEEQKAKAKNKPAADKTEKAWGVKKDEPKKKEEAPKKEPVAEKPKPKKGEMEGQMDLFSMMGL